MPAFYDSLTIFIQNIFKIPLFFYYGDYIYYKMRLTLVFPLLLCFKYAVCQFIQLNSSKTIRNKSCLAEFTKNLFNNSGTQDLPHEDVVKIQYKQLPYPKITGRERKAEELFYNRTRSIGMSYKNFIDNDVEILNNFIFKGNRDVR